MFAFRKEIGREAGRYGMEKRVARQGTIRHEYICLHLCVVAWSLHLFANVWFGWCDYVYIKYNVLVCVCICVCVSV